MAWGVDDPVLRHPVSGERLHLPSAVRRLGRRGEDLDAQVRRVPNRPIEIDQVRSGRPEEEDVRLYDVVLGEDDVGRSADREEPDRACFWDDLTVAVVRPGKY